MDNHNNRDESGSMLSGDAIPSLAASRPAKGNRSSVLIMIGLLVVVIGVGVFMVKRHLEKRSAAQEPAKVQDVASTKGPKLVMREKGLEQARSEEAGAKATPSDAEPKFAGDETPREALARSRKVPAIEEEGGDAKPIRVIKDGQGGQKQAGGRQQLPPPNPVDAPVFASSFGGRGPAAGAGRNVRTANTMEADEAEANDLAFKRSLADMQKRKADLEAQLAKIQSGAGAPAAGGGMLPPPGFMQTAQAAFGQPGAGASEGSGQPEPNTQLLGGMEKSATPRVYAGAPLNRSLTIPKGQIFQCALKTKVVTATSGFVSCLVQRDVYSHDGKVVLVERGSHMDGEYRMVNVRPGLTRIPVVWTRILTPNAIPVDLESPAVGQLGESGIGGHVDNRWPERIGAALLISLIDDSIKALLQNGNEQGNQVYLSSTSAQGSKLAEEVLKTTVNIPPLLYQNQGSVVGVYVARDLDFSKVYRLEPQQ